MNGTKTSIKVNTEGDKHELHIHELATYKEPSTFSENADCSKVGKLVHDLGTVTSEFLGIKINLKDADLKITGSDSIIGKVLVLHQKDDKSEGTPEYCGVIISTSNYNL